MDVQVDTVDIHTLELPASATYLNAILACALIVYIVATVYALKKQRAHPPPLLSEHMEL